MMRTRDEWREMLALSLPPKQQYVERNRAITAYYASWYLQRPQLFKWAGMAAFVSDQIGIGLKLSTPLLVPTDMIAGDVPSNSGLLSAGLALSSLAFKLALAIPVAMHEFAARQILLNDLDVIRDGNNAIFDDIGWAHMAYLHDGIEAIEASVSEIEREYLLRGFQMIDAGARKLADPAERAAGERLIRAGNAIVLLHEQLHVAEHTFHRVTDMGKVITSLGGILDFPGNDGAGVGASFSNHFGYLSTVSGRRLLANFDDRMEWLEHDLLPAWDKIDASYCEGSPLHQHLATLASRAPQIALV